MAFSYRLVCAACGGFEPERARSRGNAQRFPAQPYASAPHIKPKPLFRSKPAHKRQLFAKNKEK